MKAYTAYSKDALIRKQSSSGGIFYPLAKYVISHGGVVFGAAWTADWQVEMKSAKTLEGVKAFMGSKYVKANLKNTLAECKSYLDLGLLVLYSGTPCQIFALKSFLKDDYKNLLTVSIACEGTMPLTMWDEYLQSVSKPNCTIVDINMRSKENTTWDDYNLVITYSDGTKLIENHKRNKYLKTLVAGGHFQPACYNCMAKKNFKADLIIGDWWCVGNYNKIDTKDGVSFVLSNSDKGEEYLSAIGYEIYLLPTGIEFIKKHNIGIISPIPKGPAYDITKQAKEKPAKPLNKKVGIITMNLHYNIGTTLQAYALQQVIKEKGYDCDIITWKRGDIHKFAYDNISINLLNSYRDFDKIKEKDYDIFIIGSDQVWNRVCLSKDYRDKALEYPFLTFTDGWTKVRFSYASSLGKGGNFWEYSSFEEPVISNILKQFNAISLREQQSVLDFKKHFDINAEQLIDPTLLLSKEHYLKFCTNIDQKPSGVFKYVLNETQEHVEKTDQIASLLRKPIITHAKGSVCDWLACYRDASLVVTNSYHGVLFAIIFNKPFIYWNNRDGGNIRFDTIEELFGIKYRCLTAPGFAITQKIFEAPNINLQEFIKKANTYIDTNLNSSPKVLKVKKDEIEAVDTYNHYNPADKQVWLCFISSDNYLYYALDLYKSLLDTDTKYPVYCGVTKNVSQRTVDVLNTVGVKTILLDTADVEHSGIVQRSASHGMCQKYINALTKLDLLKLDIFDKAVYLDVDLHVFSNIDELFDKPHMSAVEDVAPARYSRHITYKVGDSIFCSGLLVWDFKNNKGLIQRIISELDLLPDIGQWHDQNILNYYYPTWKDHKELHLDPTYGLMNSSEVYNIIDYKSTPKVRHYVQSGKEHIPFNSPTRLPRVLNYAVIINAKEYYQLINESIKYFNNKYSLNIPPVHVENLYDPQGINAAVTRAATKITNKPTQTIITSNTQISPKSSSTIKVTPPTDKKVPSKYTENKDKHWWW